MKKRWIVLLCVLLITVCVLALGVLIVNTKYSKDTPVSCCVSTSGGMRGGLHEMSLKKDSDGNTVLSVRQKESHDERIVTTTYTVDAESFSKVAELVNRHHLYAASKMPMSKVRILDGDTTTVSFDYEKGYFSVHEEQIMSSGMREGFRAVAEYLSSLAVGEGVVTKDPQNAVLHLKSGYTLQFTVADVFDGRLDAILGKEHEVSAFKSSGIILAKGERPELSGAEPANTAASGTIIYSPQDDSIILLYEDETFSKPVYELARLNGYLPSAAPLIAEMQGEYSFRLN